MPYDHPIPDAPIAPSMLPRVAAADLTSQDVLVLTQPGNNPGQKNKGLELGALFGAPFAAPAYAAAAAPKFYEFTYDGALPRNGIAPGGQGVSGLGTRIAYLEVPFKHQAIFWIDGYSNTATSYKDPYDSYIGSYTYALRLTARSYYAPDADTDRDIFYPCFTGRRVGTFDSSPDPDYEPLINIPKVGNRVPYNANGKWAFHNPATEVHSATPPNKELSLFAMGGYSNNTYQAQDPSAYHLNIHVLVFPDYKYDFPAG